MSDISVGAVGAAAIAGLVSLLGLIIGKEQKVSEFRQSWIDDLRRCLVAYVVHINLIADALRLRIQDKSRGDEILLENYRSLNEASLGIKLRVNYAEVPAEHLLKAMTNFENLAKENADLTPDNITRVEEEFLLASRELLKSEWNVVKRGEKTFIWTKRLASAAILLMLSLLIFAWISRDRASRAEDVVSAIVQPATACCVGVTCPNFGEEWLHWRNSEEPVFSSWCKSTTVVTSPPAAAARAP